MSDGVPSGAIQAITTSASVLVVVTVAFTGWWVFGVNAGDWTWESSGVLVLAGLGLLSLGAVPVLAAGEAQTLRPARRAYAAGALLAFAAFCWGVSLTFIGDEPDTPDSGTAGATCPGIESAGQPARRT